MSLLRFSLAVAAVCSLQLHYNSTSTFFDSPCFPEGPKPNVTAIAIFVPDMFDDIWDGNHTLLDGKIAIYSGEDPPGQFREDFVRRAAALGLVGLIGWTTWTPDHFFEIDHSSRLTLTIPYVTIRKTDMYLMEDRVNTGNALITLADDSPNEWMEVFDSLTFYILWRIGLGISSVCLALLAAQKLYLWFVNYRAVKSFSQIAVLCLIVEFLCNIERAGFFALGGLGGTRQVSWMFIRVALSVSFPLTYLTTALTVAYIHEVLTAKSPMGTMIARTKKPLMGLTIFYLFTDVPISIVSAFRISSEALLLATISGIGITVGLTVTALALLYIVYKLRKYSKKSVAAKVVNAGPGKDGVPAPPDRLVVLLDRVQTSTYFLLFTTVASIMTQTPLFTTPQGFVAIQAAIMLGLMTTSYLHIVAYGRTPIRLQAKKEKEREKYARLSQSTASSPPAMGRVVSTKPKFGKNDAIEEGNTVVKLSPAVGAFSKLPEQDEQDITPTPSPMSTTATETPVTPRVQTIELLEPRRLTTQEAQPAPSSPILPKNLMQTLDSAIPGPRLSFQTLDSAIPGPRLSFGVPAELPDPTPIRSLRTLESATIDIKDPEPNQMPNTARTQTLESAHNDRPALRKIPQSAEKPVNERAPTIVITDTQASAAEWKDNHPPGLMRQSSFAATRTEQTGSPVLVEERGSWQVIKDGLGRTYYNNLLTRMTTWTDHTESVPPPYEELYPEGFGVAKAKVATPDVKPALLEERGDWMAILAPTGHVYYHNKLSRMQTWSDPTAEVSEGADRRLLLDEKGNWQEILDSSGKVYYNNKLTRQLTWTTPEEMLESTNG